MCLRTTYNKNIGFGPNVEILLALDIEHIEKLFINFGTLVKLRVVE
jgi:hypothetical protein